MSVTLTVDVFSDIACPWCYIGKRRFEQGLALAAAGDDPPQVVLAFRSFELSPDTPVDFVGGEADYLAAHKGISSEQAQRMLEQVTAVAAEAGLEYRFDRVQHTNTVKAHELLHFAAAQGRQPELAERLMSAYFSEGRHLGRVDELVALAADAGLDPHAARAVLEAHTYLPAVRADQAMAAEYGISGVPFFVLDGTYGISGAQSAEVFAQALNQVWAERRAAAAP